MFKSKFFKIIILAFLAAFLLISTDINITSVNAQSNDLTTLQSELENLQKSYEEFDSKLQTLKELFNQESINNENNKSDWFKPVKSGISTEQENQTFKDTYTSFEYLKNRRDILNNKFEEIENNKRSLSKKNREKFDVFKKEIEKIKISGQGSHKLFSSIDQLGIIIQFLEDGKLTAEELCTIQRTLGITTTFNLTEVYEDKPNSCGYFFAQTQGIIKEKLDLEMAKLKENIKNMEAIILSSNFNDTNESQLPNSIILPLLLFLLFAILLIFILWQIIKPKFNVIEENTEFLDDYDDNNNQKIEQQKEVVKEITTQSKIKDLENITTNTNSVINVETKPDLQQEEKKAKIISVKPSLSKKKLGSAKRNIKSYNRKNIIKKVPESSVNNSQLITSDSPLEKTKWIVKLTEETIDQVWKGNKENIAFEPDENGEYLVIKTDEEEYYLYFNEEIKIRPEVLITCKKAGIFKMNANVEYVKIEHIKPAKVKQITSNYWQLIESGEVRFLSAN